MKTVPWGDVIDNAPKVAKGAKALWQRVGQGAAAFGSADEDAPVTGASAEVTATALRNLQAQVARLHDELAQASALIQSLAEQNRVLTQQVEANRRRALTLTVGLIGVAALAALAWLS